MLCCLITFSVDDLLLVDCGFGFFCVFWLSCVGGVILAVLFV